MTLHSPRQPVLVLSPSAPDVFRAQLAEIGLPVATNAGPEPGDIVWIDAAIEPEERCRLVSRAASAAAHVAGTSLPTDDWARLATLRAALEKVGTTMRLVSPLLGTHAGMHVVAVTREFVPSTGFLSLRGRGTFVGANARTFWVDEVWAAVSFLAKLHRNDPLTVTGASLVAHAGVIRLVGLLRSARGVLWSIEIARGLPGISADPYEVTVELLSPTQVVRALPYHQRLELLSERSNPRYYEWSRPANVALAEAAVRGSEETAMILDSEEELTGAVDLLRDLQRAADQSHR